MNVNDEASAVEFLDALELSEVRAHVKALENDLEKAKGPGMGTRYRTQRRNDDNGRWVDGVAPNLPSRSSKPVASKPKPVASKPKPVAPKPERPAPKPKPVAAEPAKPSKPAKPGRLGDGDLYEFFDGVNEDMPEHVIKAFGAYIGGTSFHLNGNLRQGNGPVDAYGTDLSEMQDGMDEGMRPLPGNISTFRGLEETFEDLFGSKPEVGGIIEDAGYMSTTTNRDVARKFGRSGAVIELDIPAGTKSMWMPSVPGGSGVDEESELLLARGQRLEITAVEQVYMGFNEETGAYEPDPDHKDTDGFTVDRVKVRVVPQHIKAEVIA